MGQIRKEENRRMEKGIPDILLLMTDEQKLDTFGYNNSIVKTPNLDGLIQDSIFFNNAYCSNPVFHPEPRLQQENTRRYANVLPIFPVCQRRKKPLCPCSGRADTGRLV